MNIETELKNTQARLNLMSSAVSHLISCLTANQPDYIHEQIGEIMRAWDQADEPYPIEADNPDQPH